jgi:ubiquinone/menaquinone biosynthesis C-methylase UbiE
MLKDSVAIRNHLRKLLGREVRDIPDPDSQLQLVKQQFSDAKTHAEDYRRNTTTAHFYNTRLQRVSELIGDFRVGRVLDIGCGPAIIGTVLNARPIEYYGVDVSKEMIQDCIGRYGHDRRFRFAVGRIEKLPFPDSYFDIVLCLGILEYVLEFHVAINEIARVVKPKGIVIATMLNGMSPYRMWRRFVYSKIMNGIGRLKRLRNGISNGQRTRRAALILHREKDFRHLLASEGLEVKDIVYYDFNLFLAPLDARFSKAAVFLSKKLEFLCRSKLKFLGTGFIIKCRKH